MNRDMMNPHSPSRWLLWVVVGIFLVLATGGALFLRQQRSHIQRQAEEQLLTIARFKAKEIAQWRAERLHDAGVLAGDPFFLEAAYAWTRSPDPVNERKILSHFRSIQAHYSYWNVLLTAPNGKNQLVLSGPPGWSLGEASAKSLATAMRTKRAVMTDMLPGASPLPVRLNAIAPLLVPSRPEGAPFGALVLVNDVESYLFPAIRSWPIPSVSAESLLVRRDGDSVLFLNELRHRRETALNLRIPLARTVVPAVMAVAGRQGIVAGLDYRGVRVLAALQPVAGTDWHLVAKMDESEALAAWRFRSRLVSGLTIALFLAAVTTVWAVWQRRTKLSYGLQLAAEKATRATQEQYRAMLMCIGDGVIVTDDKGVVALMNSVAEELTGWTQAEALGNSVETVFDICNEHTGQKVDNPIRKVIEHGRTVGLANHTVLISRSGVHCPIMDSSAPVREAGGDLIGVVLVFRDQSAERTAQRLLQAERDNVTAILRASPVGLVVFDAAEHVVAASPEAERLFGRKVSAGERLRGSVFLGCSDAAACASCSLGKAIREALVDNKAVQNQEHVLVRDVEGGAERLFLSFGVAPVLLGGRCHAVVALQDVSARRQAEMALQRSHDLLNEVGEAARIGGWELDPRSMAGAWTDTMYDIFEVPRGEKPALEDALLFYHPDDRATISEAVNNAIKKGTQYDLEVRFTTAKGRSLWVRSLCRPFVEDGQAVRLIGILQDVTAPKRASLELKERTEEIERYFSTALDLFCIADGDGRLKRANPEWSNLLGYPLDELEGRLLFEFIHPDDVASTRQAWLDLGRQRPMLNFVNRCRRRDGAWHWLEWRAFPSGSDVFAAARNVTDRVMAEQRSEKLAHQLQHAMKMEAVGRLAGGVAHDFNNYLTGIGGYADLIIGGLAPDDPIVADLNEIKKATKNATTLTRQLLAFSRKQLFEPRVVSLNDLVASVQKMIERLIGEDIELKAALSDTAAAVKIDPGQFEQILVNLAVNARDAMPDGGRLTIETATVNLDDDYHAAHPYTKPGRHVLLAVSDTGLGMSKEVMSHLFEPFYTTKQKGKGTGLGLATIYGIVKQSDGSIEVYSEPGKGTTFKIYLPATAETPEQLEMKKPASSAMPRGDETILLVEDEGMVRELATRVLTHLSYTVLAASNGADALEMAQKHNGVIDLLITDVVMPGMNGRQLSERLLQVRPNTKVLFTSGYTENAIAHHGILEKEINFIGKPYSSRDLAQKIRQLLD